MKTMGLVFSSLLVLGACGVGDDGGELPMTPEERLCKADLSITGTFTLGMPVPDEINNETGAAGADGMPDFSGCWPTGQWTFRATVTETDCATPPVPDAEYRFATTYTTDAQGGVYNYMLQAPALSDNYRLKVTSGGGGLCEGVMELYLDGAKKAWILHPALDSFNMSGPLTGVGEYGEYPEAIYP